MNNISDDIRIILINKSGDMNVIFSSFDMSNKNTCNLSVTDDINKINLFYKKVKDTVYKETDNNDKHLFYLKQHISDNLKNEFKNINIENINDDLLLYYYLSTMGYIVFINSLEHINIIVTPSDSISNEQENRLIDFNNFFEKNIIWNLANEMHIETFEDNGKKYGMLEVGNVIEGKYEDVINKYLSKIKRH